MKPIRILVAIKQLSLLRVIKHLCYTRKDIHLIPYIGQEHLLAQCATRMHPNFIIVSSRFFGNDTALTELKRANPDSRLVLICSIEEMNKPIETRTFDACLWDGNLVEQLPSTLQQLASSP